MQTCTYGLEEGNRKPTAVMSKGVDYLSYLEQCYHNALFYDLRAVGLQVGYNVPFTVHYRGQVVGEYFADLVVENKIIIELKSVKRLADEHTAQVINYLRISGCRLGLLVNFQGTSLEWKRLVV